jgi:hypothetical protein
MRRGYRSHSRWSVNEARNGAACPRQHGAPNEADVFAQCIRFAGEAGRCVDLGDRLLDAVEVLQPFLDGKVPMRVATSRSSNASSPYQR